MIVGIVAAKENSSRFPGKNVFPVRGAPLFWHSVSPLLAATEVDDVVVATDSPAIQAYCEGHGVRVHWRHRNAARAEEPLLNVLRQAYQSLDPEYEAIVSIMANCPGHQPAAIDAAVRMLRERDLKEVRSFNAAGDESGILVLRRDVLLDAPQVSTYMGAIISDVREVHFRSDLHELPPR